MRKLIIAFLESGTLRVLRDDAPVPRPAAIELKITRPGEAVPRSFRWQL